MTAISDPRRAVRRVMVLSRYDASGASSRVRFYQYRDLFDEMGWDMHFEPLMDSHQVSRIGNRRSAIDLMRLASSYLTRIAAILRQKKFDALWIEKELLPFVPGIFEKALLSCAPPFVVDFDDAIFHNYDRSNRAVVRKLLSGKFDHLLPDAAAVTAGSAYLAEFAIKAGVSNVVRIPSTVDLTRYDVAQYPPHGVLRVGWVGSRTTSAHLDALLPALASAARSVPIELVTIGATPMSQPGLRIEQHAWSQETETALIATCHVGIMPLPDNPWERGKCAYKLIQFMACGRPVIASPVGANRDVVAPETGRLAASLEEWVDALVDCASNHKMWEYMGVAARQRAATLYSKQVVGPQIVRLFDSIAARSLPKHRTRE